MPSYTAYTHMYIGNYLSKINLSTLSSSVQHNIHSNNKLHLPHQLVLSPKLTPIYRRHVELFQTLSYRIIIVTCMCVCIVYRGSSTGKLG